MFKCNYVKALKRSLSTRNILKHKKGVAGLVIGLVIGLVTIGIVITMGLYLNVQLYNAMPEMTGVANETAQTLFNNIMSAYSLSTMIPIVAAAGAILAVVVGFLVVRHNKGG